METHPYLGVVDRATLSQLYPHLHALTVWQYGINIKSIESGLGAKNIRGIGIVARKLSVTVMLIHKKWVRVDDNAAAKRSL